MQYAIVNAVMTCVACESRICDVTVYARGAVVTREVVIPSPLADGQVDLLVGGLTPLLQEASVQATISASERCVVGLRCEVTSAEHRAEGSDDDVGTNASDDPASASAQSDAGSGALKGFSDFEAHLAELERNVEQIAAWKSSLVQQRQDLGEMLVRPKNMRSVRRAPMQRIGDGLAVVRIIDELTAEIDAELFRVERELQRAMELRDDALVAKRHVSLARNVAGQARFSRVTVRLQGAGAVQSLRISYVVKAARWWPVYTLRLQHPTMKGQWAIEALVAQYSGEDWNDVAISLCTANLVDDVRLPKLPSLRLGRAMPEVRSGYRPVPSDLDRMFQGFDRAFEGKLKTKRVSEQYDAGERDLTDLQMSCAVEQVDRQSRARGDGGDNGRQRRALSRDAAGAQNRPSMVASMAPLMAPPTAMVAPGAVPQVPSSSLARSVRAKAQMCVPMAERSVEGGGISEDKPRGSSGEQDSDDARAMQPDDAWLDFNGLRLISGVAQGADQHSRGRLRRGDDGAVAREQRDAVSRLEKVCPALSVRDPLQSRGSFDHCYRAQATSDVQSDALVHRVPIVAAEVQTESVYRATPLVSPEVFRELIIKNPFDYPMLDGPGEVFVDGSLVATTDLGRIDRGGMMRVGMGVEERIRVARNVTVKETTSGLFGGTTCVSHEVRIELRSGLGSNVIVEVLDRIPETDDKDIEIERTKASHKLVPYTQQERGEPIRGGVSINVEVPAGQTQTVLYGYVINLPSKNEIVGGNRRD